MKHMTTFAIGLILAVATVAIEGAHAEGYVTFRGGGAVTQDSHDGSVSIGPVEDLPKETMKGTFEFDPGPDVGLGVGYWFESSPTVGVGIDFSYFDADLDDSDPIEIGVVPITALLLLRYPLMKSDLYPRGRLQPYAALGGGLFITNADVDLKKFIGAPKNFSDTTVAGGFDARAGVSWHFALPPEFLGETVALFVEYRFTHFKPPKFEDDIAGLPIEIDLGEMQSHHASLGVGLYF